MTTIGQEVSLWAVRLALFAWFVFAVLRIASKSNTAWRSARAWWTLATGLYLLHVVTAFACFHNWSHAEAVVHTADVTHRFTGFRWGGGIWFNHLFTLVVAVETMVWWAAPQAILQRSRIVNVAIYGWCLFIALNASVVFVAGWFRYVGLAGFAALCLILLCQRHPTRNHAA
jgi:hypothetical protein